jgi:exopolysaccharide biosynthesis predicted pyruvyltransferase EpsI
MASQIKHDSPFKQIKELASAGRKIIFIPNPGNFGDALICAAAIQGFEKAGVYYSVYSSVSTHDASFVYVYCGGGNLVPYYNNCASVLRDLSSVGAEVIVLPHSCYGPAAAEVISTFKGKLTVWARERTSLGFLLNVPGNFSYGLEHDLALNLDITDKRLHQFLMFDKLVGLAGIGASELLAFRGDCEAISNRNVNWGLNVDISNNLGYMSKTDFGFGASFLDINSLFNSVSWLLAYIRLFGIVRTDRLHVAIGALLLGIKVVLTDNSYGKNKAIYEYSLRERFGGLIIPSWGT